MYSALYLKVVILLSHTHLFPICSSRSHLCRGQQRQRAMRGGSGRARQNAGRGRVAWCRSISVCQQTSKLYLWKSFDTSRCLWKTNACQFYLLYSQGLLLMVYLFIVCRIFQTLWMQQNSQTSWVSTAYVTETGTSKRPAPPLAMACTKDWIGCLVSSRTINNHLLSTTNLLHPISDLTIYS